MMLLATFYYVHLLSRPQGKKRPYGCVVYDKRHWSSTAQSPSRLRCARQSRWRAPCHPLSLLWVILDQIGLSARRPLSPDSDRIADIPDRQLRAQELTSTALFDHPVAAGAHIGLMAV